MSVPMTCVGRGLFLLLALALIATPALGQANPSAVTWNEKIEVAAGGGFREPKRPFLASADAHRLQ